MSNSKIHQITIESIGIDNEIEWREIVTGGNKVAARRKANRIVWNTCLDDVKIEKRVNQYDDNLEIWRLK
jgi:hypothetical protein